MDRVEQPTSTRTDRMETVRKTELLDDIHMVSEEDPMEEERGGGGGGGLQEGYEERDAVICNRSTNTAEVGIILFKPD